MAKRLLKMLLKFVGAIAALLLVLLLIGFFLPSTFDITASRVVQARPSAAYAFLINPRTWIHWSPWNPQNFEGMRSSYDGPESGVGARWTWDEPILGEGYLQITDATPYTQVRYRQEHAAFDDVLEGHITLDSLETGTQITWRYHGSLGTQPWMRWIMFLLESPMAEDYYAAIDGLDAHLQPP